MDTNELCDQSTGDADNGADSRTMGGQDERLKVLAYTEEQVWLFCRSHMLPRRNVVRIRRPEELRGWMPGVLLLFPSYWLGTISGTVADAENSGWKIAQVTEDEVLNGPTPPAPAFVSTNTGRDNRAHYAAFMAAERPTPISDEAHEPFEDTVNEELRHFVDYKVSQALERKLAEARDQRDRLAKALCRLRAYTSWGMSPVEKTAAEQEADEALASVKESSPNDPAQARRPADGNQTDG